MRAIATSKEGPFNNIPLQRPATYPDLNAMICNSNYLAVYN